MTGFAHCQHPLKLFYQQRVSENKWKYSLCRAVSRGLGLFNQLRNLKPSEETMCWYSALSLPPLICVAVSIWLRRIYFQKFQAALINCPRFDRRRVAELCIPEPLFCIPKQSWWRGSAQSLISLLAAAPGSRFPGWEQSLQELHFVCESGWMGVEASLLEIRTQRCNCRR